MREIPRKLWSLVARLLPKQNNSGSGAVQVGRAGGDVKVLHVTQHIYGTHIPPQGSHVLHHHPYHGHHAAKDVHLVLALLDQVPDRIAVLDFMGREFGTRMVIELTPAQLFRVRRYVEVILAAQVGK